MSRQILVSVTGDQVKDAPSYDEAKPITREVEVELHEHYELPAYWEQDNAQPAENQ
jgi:hypothetical protein